MSKKKIPGDQQSNERLHPASLVLFGEYAGAIALKGLCVVPCGGEDGKRPLIVGWSRPRRRRSHHQLVGLLSRFQWANVGIACGPSNLVIVDIDAGDLLGQMLERFGVTPLIVRTPSGGFHLYYRAGPTPLRCKNLRHEEGLDVDIKAVGGLVIAPPPSRNPQTGQSYTFYRGSWDMLGALPQFITEALGAQPEGGAKTISDDDLNVSQVPRGQRNTHLFQELLRTAPHCDDFEALLDVARTRNAFVYEAPLPDAEVVRTASSAWRYECEGRNWVGRAPTTVLDREELHLFAGHKNGGDALLLWSYLEGQHAKRAADIVVDRKAMAAANLLPEWTEWRYRKAIKALRDLQLLRLVAQGGSQNRRFGPHRFRLVRPVERFRPNTMKTSPPASIRKDEGDQTQNIQNCSTITKAGRRR